MASQRDKDIEAWESVPPNESHSGTFADGAEYARKQAARELMNLAVQGLMDEDYLRAEMRALAKKWSGE